MFSKSFCSSPWFHLRLTYNGDFNECRWYKENTTVAPMNISTTSIMEFYNSDRMRQLRSDLLNGQSPTGCTTCYYEDTFNKLNGRTRQLLKSAIKINDFDRTTRSSPHYQRFLHSQENHGHSNYQPVDLQIDLGNICNSACIMCDPVASSQLHNDYKKLHKLNSTLFKNPAEYQSWTQDPDTLDRVIAEIIAIPNLKYIHFLGGETLYNQAFYVICDRLIEANVAKDIIVGTTTNGTIYSKHLEHIIPQFKEFHLGISIESVTKLNDYVRYPGKIDSILPIINQFLTLRNTMKLYISLRITPNIFTISEIDQIFEYMIGHKVIAESCNILFEPACLRVELMPTGIREQIIKKLDQLIVKYNVNKTYNINVRCPSIIDEVIANTIIEYHTFLSTYIAPTDIEFQRKQLVIFLKSFESIRDNSIVDYAPEYEQFLKNYGY